MNTNLDQARALLPLTPAVYHVLLALAISEKHGYGVMREVKEISMGAVELGPATLYRSIKQMLEHRLIIESDDRPDPALDDERRKYYKITELGLAALQLETSRLSRLVERARQMGVTFDEYPELGLGGRTQ